MVDVSAKAITVRQATARGTIAMERTTAEKIRAGETKKGDVLAVARLAAIQASKWTSQLIPLCHAIPIEAVQVDFHWVAADDRDQRSPNDDQPPNEDKAPDENRVRLRCDVTVRTSAKTGVEMEAMTAVSIACLTVYDMVKGVDRAVSIGPIELLAKSGGKSGDFRRPTS